MTVQSCPFAHGAFTIDPSGTDVHGEAAQLRQRGRATRAELLGVETWWVTDHALIKQLLTDPRVSRDPYRHWPAWENGEGELARTWPLAAYVADRNLFTAYGEEHKRLRKLVAGAFTARRTAAMKERIEEIAAEVIERLTTLPAGQPVDLRQEFAYPLPARVISELLGIPAAARAKLLPLVDGLLRTTNSVEEMQQIEKDLMLRTGELIEEKRANPGDDLTSALVLAHDDSDGSGLTFQELTDTLVLIFMAGYETTVNLLDHAVFALLTRPDQLQLVRQGSASWKDVVEETLRLEAPLMNVLLRYAVEDIELEDLTISKGEPIVVSFGAAGRDPGVHGDDADGFDVTRSSNREHIAFGFGAHHCLGAPLARLEAEITLPALFNRFPQLALATDAGEVKRGESFVNNGHEALPVLLGAPSATG
ncbi:cytochrome P450 [Streptomyces sp. DG2A-72]|uniref:cytochrome P450 family protein n=1 Tax=Streptomyces sp. DG2A-72 TaxID=3051386 RepID=UPI00265B8C26|nr:cytochrome P450 [Streptomyces sp. DG2A-72]MDO0939344.1 cytochrome P450 [Streptomyces sp. DG2A-72]